MVTRKGERNMYCDTIKSGLPWMVAGLVIGFGGSTALTAAPVAAPAVPAESAEQMVLSERGAGEGHGSYCLVPEQGAYFYGRDLSGEVGTYQDFESWCVVHGGSLDWIE
jgi:hypothetical protein